MNKASDFITQQWWDRYLMRRGQPHPADIEVEWIEFQHNGRTIRKPVEKKRQSLKRIALTGYSRQGKDTAAIPLIAAGYVQVSFGDLLKKRLEVMDFDEAGEFGAYLGILSADRKQQVLNAYKIFLLTDRDVWTDNTVIKGHLRPLFEEYGMFRYAEITADLFAEVAKHECVVNTRLMRLPEAEAWVANGGEIWEIIRDNNPATEFERQTQQELRDSELIKLTIFNSDDVPYLHKCVANYVGIELAPEQGRLEYTPQELLQMPEAERNVILEAQVEEFLAHTTEPEQKEIDWDKLTAEGITKLEDMARENPYQWPTAMLRKVRQSQLQLGLDLASGSDYAACVIRDAKGKIIFHGTSAETRKRMKSVPGRVGYVQTVEFVPTARLEGGNALLPNNFLSLPPPAPAAEAAYEWLTYMAREGSYSEATDVLRLLEEKETELDQLRGVIEAYENEGRNNPHGQ